MQKKEPVKDLDLSKLTKIESLVQSKPFMVKLSVCRPSRTQPKGRDTRGARDLAKQILESGGIDPVRGYWKGRLFMVVDGNRRCHAYSRWLKQTEIPAVLTLRTSALDLQFNALNTRSAVTNQDHVSRWLADGTTRIPKQPAKYRDHVLDAFKNKSKALQVLTIFTDEMDISPATVDYRSEQIIKFLHRNKVTKEQVIEWLSLSPNNIRKIKGRIEKGFISRQNLYTAIRCNTILT